MQLLLSGMHDVSVKRERSVKRPRVNEIFVLLASSSGYTIFSIDKPHPSNQDKVIVIVFTESRSGE